MQFRAMQETEVFTNFEPVFDTGDLVRICPLSLWDGQPVRFV